MPSLLVAKHPATAPSPKGDYSATFDYFGTYVCKVLDGTLFSSESTADILTFAVLNIADRATEVILPENGRCLAIELFSPTPVDGWTIPESFEFTTGPHAHPTTFNIVYHNNSSFRVPKDELNRHGMTFRTMYL